MRRHQKPLPSPIGVEEAFKMELELIDKGIVDLITRRLETIRRAEIVDVDLNSDANIHETLAHVLRYADRIGAPALIVDAAFLVLTKVMKPSKVNDGL